MKTWVKVLIGVFVGLVVVLIVGFALFTRSNGIEVVTHPMEERDPIIENPGDYGLEYEEVTVTTPDGLKLVGWYVPSTNGAAVLAMHGYKSDRQHLLKEAEFLNKHGYGVMLGSYRAHDLSDGEKIFFGDKEMADYEAWYQYMLTRSDVDPEKIGLLGESTGGALSIKYAGENKAIRALVAHSAFAAMDDTVETAIQIYFPDLPPAIFAGPMVFWMEQDVGIDASTIDSTDWIQDYCGRPVLILQGGMDDHIPTQSGQWIYDAACEPKELWYAEDCWHTGFDEDEHECLPDGVYEDRIVGFFEEHLQGD